MSEKIQNQIEKCHQELIKLVELVDDGIYLKELKTNGVYIEGSLLDLISIINDHLIDYSYKFKPLYDKIVSSNVVSLQFFALWREWVAHLLNNEYKEN